MSYWDNLFNQKLKEVLHSKHEDYVFASLSPRQSGNCARELIAKEYYQQKQKIEDLEKIKQELLDDKAMLIREKFELEKLWK